MHKRRMRYLLWRLVVAALVLGAIWVPEIRHYWVATPHYSAQIRQAAIATPGHEVLARFAQDTWDPESATPSSRNLMLEAEQMLRGEWNQPGFGPRAIHLPFDERDVTFGWPAQQLEFAGLLHIDVLLSAYDKSHETRFLAAARDAVNAWADFESTAILPAGYLWNDHAVAQRILVLTRYWRLIRSTPLLDEHSADLLLRFVGRSGRILIRPDQFTARTNHGFMENLALLHIATCFPALPESALFKQVGLDRLRSQLGYYQSPEGVVLEHSIGYHVMGVNLLERLASYAAVLDPAMEREVKDRLAKACRFFFNLKRPDGSVPFVGDTKGVEYAPPCDAALAAQSDAGQSTQLIEYPVSGYAIAWYGRGLPSDNASSRSQTVVAWANFATRAHKHDDELAVYTWHAGLPILTGTGYWSYGERRQKTANSWRGANAPFLTSEAPPDQRESELVASGHSDNITVVDLVRTEPSRGSSVHRQVVTLGPGKWLVVDYSSTQAPQSVTTVWTLYPGWTVSHEGNNRILQARHSRSSEQLSASFTSSANLAIKTLTRSDSPFGGWVALDSSPLAISAATSIDVRAPSGAPVFSYWSVDKADPPVNSTLQRWQGPTDWSICLDGEACSDRVSRSGKLLSRASGQSSETVELLAAPSQKEARAEINANFHAMVKKYPYWMDFHPWRVGTSLALAALLLVQELILALAGSGRLSKWAASVRTLAIAHYVCTVSWIAVGSWLAFVYFRIT